MCVLRVSVVICAYAVGRYIMYVHVGGRIKTVSAIWCKGQDIMKALTHTTGVQRTYMYQFM